MTVLTVGVGKQYATIQAAVVAAKSGDTVSVGAGTYVNDFVSVYKNLTIEAVGKVSLVATTSPPNGKAIIDAGGAGITVTLKGLEISGAVVPDGNGAGVRYEGGTLNLVNVNIHNNQDGLLANADPNGVITIDGSTFTANGGGTGSTHNIYVGNIASLVVKNSTITASNVGHDIKSRAASTTIVNNVIADGANGNSSYEIDLPQGGVGLIQGNVIQKGPNAQNPVAIAFGEEGNLWANSSLTVTGNTMTTTYTAHNALAVWNATSGTASVTNNAFYGWKNLSNGPAAVNYNSMLTDEPVISALTPAQAGAAISYTDTTTGQSGNQNLSANPAGAPSYVQGSFIWSGSHGVAIGTGRPNVFLKGGAAGDALLVVSGQNVLDGGGGSNFLIGGSGNDLFYNDARGGASTWSTLVNFHAGDTATLWGFAGAAMKWDAGMSGAGGFLGATLRTQVDGASASLTFAGLSVAQAQAMHVSTGTSGGVSYLQLTR